MIWVLKLDNFCIEAAKEPLFSSIYKGIYITEMLFTQFQKIRNANTLALVVHRKLCRRFVKYLNNRKATDHESSISGNLLK